MAACTDTQKQSTQCSIEHPIRKIKHDEQPGNPCGADFSPMLRQLSSALLCWCEFTTCNDELVLLWATTTRNKWERKVREEKQEPATVRSRSARGPADAEEMQDRKCNYLPLLLLFKGTRQETRQPDWHGGRQEGEEER